MTKVGSFGFDGGGSGGGVTDHGALTGLGDDDHTQYLLADGSRSVSGLLDCNAGLDVDGALTDIGTGSYSLADGDDDLGVAGDLEVDDDLQLDGTMGINVAPASGAFITASADGSVIRKGIDIDLTTTYDSTPLTSGLNILDFILADNMGTTGGGTTARAGFFQVQYDRATSSNSTHRAIGSKYGVKSPMSGSRVLSSGTHTWRGLYISIQDASLGDVTGGTIEAIDIETEEDPSGYGSATFTHKAAKFGAVVQIVTGGLDIDAGDIDMTSGDINVSAGAVVVSGGDITTDQFIGAGEASPATAIEAAEQETLGGNQSDGYSAAITIDPEYNAPGPFTRTVTRHNYIDVQDVTTTGTTAVTDACVMRFNAAAGTHKAVDSGTTKGAGIVTTDAWIKINVNGNVGYIPVYTSKT